MKIIGVTGGVGAGKSTVLHMLEKLCRCKIIMADDVAKEMMNYGGPLTDKALQLFGDNAYDSFGKLNKEHIASIIYADDAVRAKWNDAVHPAVNNAVYNEIKNAGNSNEYDFVFVEAALLIENKYDEICDELWYVYADADVRRERLIAQRGYSHSKIDGIFDSQMSDDDFRKHCDFIIDTGKSIENTYDILKNKLEEYA